MMDNKAMCDALRQRKGQGLDITIVLGDPDKLMQMQGMGGEDSGMEMDDEGEEDGKEEEQELGLAPKASPVGEDQTLKDEAVTQSTAPAVNMDGDEVLENKMDQPNPIMQSALEDSAMNRPGSLVRRALTMNKKK